MLRTLTEKTGNTEKQMGNINGEMQTVRKNQKEMLGIINTKQN